MVSIVSEVQHGLADPVDARTLATLVTAWLSPVAFAPGAVFSMQVAPNRAIVHALPQTAGQLTSSIGGGTFGGTVNTASTTAAPSVGIDGSALFVSGGGVSLAASLSTVGASTDFRAGVPDLPDVESYQAYIDRYVVAT